jgi:multicomponent K+:H+ antiporter subunit G
MTMDTLPLWVTIPGTVLLVLSGLAIVAGSLGLLRFPEFFARVHGPSMTSTAGAFGVLITSALSSSAIAGRPMFHELLIVVLLLGTAPVTSIVMLQAALYRNRARYTHDPAAPAEEQSRRPSS